MHQTAAERQPTRPQAIAFAFKAACFRARRSLKNITQRPPRHQSARIDDQLPVTAESRAILYTSDLGAEFALQAGKVQNLRAAARHLDGLIIPAGQVFSFWRQVPRPTHRRHFVAGRELREGCVIPNVGGGLCQLTNSLYDAALKSNCEIIERHAHSRTLPGSMAANDRDATIFWNYVDLRFRPKTDTQLEVTLGRGELIIRFRSKASPQKELPIADKKIVAGDPAESCETCGVTSCFRHPSTLGLTDQAITAWLVDAYWPEHDAYMQFPARQKRLAFHPTQTTRPIPVGHQPVRYRPRRPTLRHKTLRHLPPTRRPRRSPPTRPAKTRRSTRRPLRKPPPRRSHPPSRQPEPPPLPLARRPPRRPHLRRANDTPPPNRTTINSRPEPPDAGPKARP